MTSARSSSPNPSIRDGTPARTHTTGWASHPFPPALCCAPQPGISTASGKHTHRSQRSAISILHHLCVLPGSSTRSQLCQGAQLSSCQPHRFTLAATLQPLNPHAPMSITTDGAVNPGCSHALPSSQFRELQNARFCPCLSHTRYKDPEPGTTGLILHYIVAW